jgi:uncharacterized membrane protein
MTMGPVQILVIGYPSGETPDGLLSEVEQIRAAPGIELLDLIHVRKHEDGRIERIEISDLSATDAEAFGALIGNLTGIDDGDVGAPDPALANVNVDADQDAWYVDDTIPPGSAATVVLIEHRWAIGVRDQMRADGGVLLADAWVHPFDLAAVGLLKADEAELELNGSNRA